MNNQTDHREPDRPAHMSASANAWRFLQIVNVRLRFIVLMAIVGVVAGKWETIVNYYQRWARPANASDMVVDESVEYYCPMHPWIRKGSPGNCPICGMPLSKRHKGEPTTMPEGVLAQVQMTPLKVELGRIQTSPVEYRLLGRHVRTVGQIDYDETRRAFIAARVKGRLDKLIVNFTGQKVNKGDPLALVYSPDLLVAQEELLLAAKAVKEQGDAASLAGRSARSLLESARKKLLLWGITGEQIDEIIQRGTTEDRLKIYSTMTGIVTEKNVVEGEYVTDGQRLYTIADLDKVWMQAEVFESDVAGVSESSPVEVTTRAYPQETFTGRIKFIAYTVEPATRTVKARIEVDNPGNKLKPGMYAEARIHIPIGAREPGQPATQPDAAPDAKAVQTAGLARAYLNLHAAYFDDKTNAAAVGALAAEADRIAARVPEGRQLADLARGLAGKGLAGQREQFKLVSAALIDLLKRYPPEGMHLFIAHCPMLNTDWLTDSGQPPVRNPYTDSTGQRMPGCGNITGPLPVERAGVRISPDGRFVYGYYCPVRPDLLYDKPEQCPLDNFPFPYVKAERVAAVPESAVVDTGERQVVYREASPGWFEMVQVKVGQRAGEFYPVLDGLKPGDRVVTQGAFAVDAENRLNPAAAAQYTGARGGPKAGDARPEHQH